MVSQFIFHSSPKLRSLVDDMLFLPNAKAMATRISICTSTVNPMHSPNVYALSMIVMGVKFWSPVDRHVANTLVYGRCGCMQLKVLKEEDDDVISASHFDLDSYIHVVFLHCKLLSYNLKSLNPQIRNMSEFNRREVSRATLLIWSEYQKRPTSPGQNPSFVSSKSLATKITTDLLSGSPKTFGHRKDGSKTLPKTSTTTPESLSLLFVSFKP